MQCHSGLPPFSRPLFREEIKNQLDRFRSLPEIEFATWAAELPQRKEMERLFHEGIKRYVANNMEEAWGWIHDFDEGRRKEEALVVYSSQAANEHGDWEESWGAIDLIESSDLRTNAKNWRPTWMKRMDGERGR